MEDLDLYTQQRAGDLAQKRLEIKKRLADVERLNEKGALTTDEYEQVVEIRKAAAASIEDEITAFFHADRKTFECGRRVIETFNKVYKFMTLSANNLKKIELAKMVLSKLLWDGTTLRYEYQNPFDDILKIPVIPGWWRRRPSKRLHNGLILKRKKYYKNNVTHIVTQKNSGFPWTLFWYFGQKTFN